MTDDGSAWQSTACILCECNCGIVVQLDDRKIAKIRGDKAHPASQGYTCNKALRLDHYQNNRNRLTAPLRRRDDGTYEEIDWDTAISEIAERFMAIRDEHGGDKIFYYGGGGQGNHLGGAYSGAFLKALGSRYRSNALAQEKTGEHWVDAQLLRWAYPRRVRARRGLGVHRQEPVDVPELSARAGRAQRDRQGPRTVDDRHRPGHHGHRETRRLPLARTPRNRRMVPCGNGRGAGAGAELCDEQFLADHVNGVDGVVAMLRDVPIADYALRCGVDEALLRAAARRIAGAASVSVFEDLGIQQAPNSTLCSYLNKLLWILTGNFAKRGAQHLHSSFAPLFGVGGVGRTPVTGAPIIAGLVPTNVVPDEILTDHPDRFRAMIVESSNPAHSVADSARCARR